MSTGHELARRQIAKHGQDRYPTVAFQTLKLTEEVGELAGAILKSSHPSGLISVDPRVRKEYADAGLALYELGNKLGLDLIQMMTLLVEADERKFG